MFLLMRSRAPQLLAWSGIAACIAGFIAYRMWLALPWDRFAETLELAVAALAIAALVHRLRGWAMAHTLALFAGVALVFFVGVLPVVATLGLAATAVAIGSLLVAGRRAADGVLALVTGLVLIGGALGWLLPVAVHRRGIYLVAMLVICACRANALRSSAAALWRGYADIVAEAPWHAASAVLLLALASTAAWLPTMQADDLAYHLGLPSALQQHGVYALDPTQQIWALAPWLGDVVQGVAQVLAGREARGAVDVLWMLAAAAALGCATLRMRADARIAWIVVTLFASLPLLAGLAAGMQTELPATAVLAAFALAVLLMPDRRMAFVVAVLAGGLFALKLSQLVAAIAMLVWAFARVRERIDIKRAAIAIAIFVAIAGSSYFHAWRVSGNPMLPLFNDVFQSPVMPPHQLDNPRFHAGFDPLIAWNITFDTPRYFEAAPGGMGFVLVALAGVWLLALFRRETRGLAIVASIVMLLPLLPMQYARYAFPGLVLLLPALAIAGSATLGVRRFAVVAFALCFLNVAFQANASWVLETVARKRLVSHAGDANYVLSRFAPERVLIAYSRDRDPSDSVVLALDTEAPYVAELAGRGRTMSWYAPALDVARVESDADASGARWKRAIDSTGARWLLLRPERASAALRAALSGGDAQRVETVGAAELWSWKTSP